MDRCRALQLAESGVESYELADTYPNDLAALVMETPSRKEIGIAVAPPDVTHLTSRILRHKPTPGVAAMGRDFRQIAT